MTGSNHISQYRAPAQAVQTGTYSDGRPIFTFYADPEASGGATYDVTDYGATGNGVTDDTAAIQAAINAASAAGGGRIFLPAGRYVTSATLIMPTDSLELCGVGFASVIAPVAGATFDVISNNLPSAVNQTGNAVNYQRIADLMLDCSNMTGTVNNVGNGIHYYGMRWSYIERVYILKCPNWAIQLDGDTTGSNNTSWNNHLYGILTDQCGGNVYLESEASDVLMCVFKGWNATTVSQQPTFGTQTAAYCLQLNSGRHQVLSCVFGGGGTQSQVAIYAQNSASSRILACSFDTCKNGALASQAHNTVFAFNELINPVASGGNPAIALVGDDNIIIGNRIENSGAATYTYAVKENSTPTNGNVINANYFPTGTTGVVLLAANSPTRLRDNVGYNPVGHGMTQPAVPASGTALQNVYGVDATVYLSGGTVTAVAIGGVATGATGGVFRVPAGATITLTYSVAPTWQWFGD